MNKKLIFYFFLAILPTWLLAAPAAQETSNTVDLKQPYNSNTLLYSKELLIKAYALIGYKINWLNIVSSKELELVNKGKLSAAIAKHPIIEGEFPRLVKVPYKMFDFALLKVSDRRRCGYCLDEDIHSIVYTKGARISANYAESLRSSMDKLAIINPLKLNEMILKRRADSVLIMDFQLSPEIVDNPHMIVETITREYDYHYLSPSLEHLKQPLVEAFEQLEKNGTVAKLRQKYKIKSVNDLNNRPKNVSFISGAWTDYTNTDGSGVYWNIIDSIFDDDFLITKASSIWARAVRAFEQNQVDVLVGAYRKEKLKDVIYSSFHIDYELPLYAFARNKDVLKRFKAQDTALTACLSSGSFLFKYVEFIPKGNIIETSLEQCDVLIKNNKVDIVIEYDYNLDHFTQDLPNTVLVENSPLFLVFHDNPRGHFLKSYFDKNIAELARKNALQNIFPDERTFKQAHIRP